MSKWKWSGERNWNKSHLSDAVSFPLNFLPAWNHLQWAFHKYYTLPSLERLEFLSLWYLFNILDLIAFDAVYLPFQSFCHASMLCIIPELQKQEIQVLSWKFGSILFPCTLVHILGSSCRTCTINVFVKVFKSTV